MSLVSRLSTGTLLLALGSLTLSARPVPADVLFSSLPPGGGLQLGGPSGNYSGYNELAMSFMSSETATLDSIQIPLIRTPGDNSPFTISLYSSVLDVPGDLLARQTIPANSINTASTLSNFYFGGSPVLQADTPYFLDAFTTGTTIDNWLNNQSDPSLTITRRKGSKRLFFFIASAPLPFQVNGSRVTAVPEPGSLALLAGMGIVGVAFLRRRKQVGKAA